MEIKLEKSSLVKMLSVALCVAAVLLSTIPIKWVLIYPLGSSNEPYVCSYLTIYSNIPPCSSDIDTAAFFPYAIAPVKSFVCGLLLGCLFLSSGFFYIRMRHVFHFVIGGLGVLMSCLLFCRMQYNGEMPVLLLGKIFLCSASVLSVITGVLIWRENHASKERVKRENNND